MMDKKQAIEITGRTGEKIIANMLINLGLNVQEAINHFDSEKDFTVDGKTVEVKTEQPFVYQNAFSIGANQITKCRNVDVLYFVSIPPLIRPDYKWGGWIFRAEPKAFVTRNYTTKFGKKMILIDIEQPALIPVQRMKDEEIFELSKYISSAYA